MFYQLFFIFSTIVLLISCDGKIVGPNSNESPTVSSLSNQTVNENTAVNFTLSGSDPDGDTITYCAVNPPSNLTLNSSTGAVSWTPNHTQVGSNTLVFYATDEASCGTAQNVQSVDITVSAVGTCGGSSVTWTEIGGGCKDPETDLIWSQITGATLDWSDVVWGNTASTDECASGTYLTDFDYSCSQGTQDTSDSDSVNPTNANSDTDNANNYCRDLVQNTYTDWRPPTTRELQRAACDGSFGVLGTGGFTCASQALSTRADSFGVNITNASGKHYWARTTPSGSTNQAMLTNDTGQTFGNTKTLSGTYYGICVRE